MCIAPVQLMNRDEWKHPIYYRDPPAKVTYLVEAGTKKTKILFSTLDNRSRLVFLAYAYTQKKNSFENRQTNPTDSSKLVSSGATVHLSTCSLQRCWWDTVRDVGVFSVLPGILVELWRRKYAGCFFPAVSLLSWLGAKYVVFPRLERIVVASFHPECTSRNAPPC